MITKPVPPAVFLPPVAPELLDLSQWLPNDKHRVLEFTAPDLDRALALAAAVTF